jgi:hypothetical protein
MTWIWATQTLASSSEHVRTFWNVSPLALKPNTPPPQERTSDDKSRVKSPNDFRRTVQQPAVQPGRTKCPDGQVAAKGTNQAQFNFQLQSTLTILNQLQPTSINSNHYQILLLLCQMNLSTLAYQYVIGQL